ncbi:hypothetical protein OXPF_19040 [Oxobacter pfennigii]|uniref:DUF3137 domain-containing protein n=1 Tax=Oxobacter pfennigii TaxID=36849 RepID=A0A0P8WAR8_9CLOT|nr:hypothetical protein [Oxobacter pfennigii]KPU44818.1 hypothetical protein OXPF_19040 [Oxobacter pfennigii]
MGILRDVFGPSREEIWTKLSEEIGADYVNGGFWKGDKVVAKVGDWTIILDTYTVSTGKSSVTYTRMRAPYVNKDGFRFKIYRKGIFSDLGKLFGMQDVEVGYEGFDRDFIIQGTDTEKLKELFANQKIRELIEYQPGIHLEVKDDEGWFGSQFPEGVDELCFQVTGVIKEVEVLKMLYFLFAVVLNQLCLMGSAYEDDPEIELK